MVLLAKEEKGWDFGSTRVRTAAESEIAGVAFWAAHARKEEEERIMKGAMKCSGAGGARNWRGGAAETGDGGG
jgi:hypothetical protein